MTTDKEELPVDIPNYVAHFATGSRVICNPPPTDTDLDIMILVDKGALDYVHDDLINYYDYELGGSYVEESQWRSYKKDHFNLLFTDDPDYFEKFRQATTKAKELNLLKKEERIKLFTEYLCLSTQT